METVSSARPERRLLRVEAAGVDLGVVEHVVDDDEQVMAALFDQIEILPLLRIEGAGLQQMGEADDRVHRGADLVAHRGKEPAFGLVGRLRPFLGLLELLLDPASAPKYRAGSEDASTGRVLPGIGDGDDGEFAGPVFDQELALARGGLAEAGDDPRPGGEGFGPAGRPSAPYPGSGAEGRRRRH